LTYIVFMTTKSIVPSSLPVSLIWLPCVLVFSLQYLELEVMTSM
jgi:hypothetical protein